MQGLTTEEERAFRALAARLGGRDEAQQWLLGLGLQTYLAAQPPVSTVAESLAPYAPMPPVGTRETIVSEVLAQFGVAVSRFRAARPTTLALSAFKHPIEIAGSEEYSDEALGLGSRRKMLAIAAFSECRASGSAAFSLVPPAEADVYEAALFILLDDRRGWLLTRDELVAYTALLRQKKKVPCVTLDKDRGTLRLRFPKKEIGYDLAQRLRRQT